MAKPLKYPIRRHFRHEPAIDKLLVERADIMGLSPSECVRIIVRHSLTGKPITSKPDPGAVQLLKQWAKKFSRKRSAGPGHQNWNAVMSLADETEAYLGENK